MYSDAAVHGGREVVREEDAALDDWSGAGAIEPLLGQCQQCPGDAGLFRAHSEGQEGGRVLWRAPFVEEGHL